MNKKSEPHPEYTHQIVSRSELIKLLTDAKKPLSFSDIVQKLDYQKNTGQQDGLSRRLHAMTRDGQLHQNRKTCFGVSSKMDLVVGSVQGNKDGFGFLIPDDGSKDLFIHYSQMEKAMHGDKVLAHRIEFKGRNEARIIEVLNHANQILVARFVLDHGIGIGIPVNTRIRHEILIPESMQGGAKTNHMVLLKITKQPSKRFQPVGKVISVLGGHLDPGMEIEVALHAWGIPHVFSEDTIEYVSQIPAVVDPALHADRVDLSHLPLVTIDGEDSKDFDDAVWCEPISTSDKKQGWRALVAIADVAHYVPINSDIDTEALGRGTSVYFPELVVPMLPETLSNGVCSLNPDEYRLALVCEMTINQSGVIESHQFSKALIRSHARMTYTQVGDIFEPNPSADTQALLERLPMLDALKNLYFALAKKRRERGALEFDNIETRIQFDENRKITAIIPTVRNHAHRLIEELMVSANVCAGEFLEKNKIPAPFRNHETPKDQKVDDLRQFLQEFGLNLAGGTHPEPADYADTLARAKEKPAFDLIQMVILRSMNQAVYHPDNKGHFGLALHAYAHFTSPIRRYPDLLVHRAIRHILDGKSVANYAYNHTKMQSFSVQCSMAERRADDATHDVTNWLKCEYMQDKVGQSFTGKVSSVTNFGLFIRLEQIHVDGLLHISLLPDGYYHFNAIAHRLESPHQNFSIGDRLEITVIRVDLDNRKIDFAMAENKQSHINKPNSQLPSKKKPNTKKSNTSKSNKSKPDQTHKNKSNKKRR